MPTAVLQRPSICVYLRLISFGHYLGCFDLLLVGDLTTISIEDMAETEDGCPLLKNIIDCSSLRQLTEEQSESIAGYCHQYNRTLFYLNVTDLIC